MIRPRYDVRIVREDNKIIFYKKINLFTKACTTTYLVVAFMALFFLAAWVLR